MDLTMPYRWLLLPLAVFGLGPPLPTHATCGEGLEARRQELSGEEQRLRTTEHMVRAAKAEYQSRDGTLREAMTHPPSGYDLALARRLVALRRTEVEPKRATLEQLRAQQEEARRQWEHGHQLLYAQLVQARTALQAKTLFQQDYCRIREASLQALGLYQHGMEQYCTGMDFYRQALAAYGERFLLPYTAGFQDPQQWVRVIGQLERGDFLQDFLVPMTANAVQSSSPQAPPE